MKALAAKYADPSAFLAAMAQPLQPTSEPASVIETFNVSRRIIISLVDQAERPADRIQKAVITLSMPKKEGRPLARFVSWNAFSTRFETIDYGTVKLTRGISTMAGVKTGPIPSLEIGEAGGGVTTKRSIEEEREITRKFALSTAVLQYDKAIISIKGSEYFDITDSVALDVNVEFENRGIPIKVFYFKSLYQNDKPLAPDDVIIKTQEWRLPGQDQVPIPICARLDYLARIVRSGDDTVSEQDDWVDFERKSLGPLVATLVPQDLAKLRTYLLGKGSGEAVSIVTRDGRLETLQLGDFAAASELRAWLAIAYAHRPKSTPITVGGRPLRLGDAPLHVDDLPRLVVQPGAAANGVGAEGQANMDQDKVGVRLGNQVDLCAS